MTDRQRRRELVKRAIKKLVEARPNISNVDIQKEIGLSHMTYYRWYKGYVNNLRDTLYR